MIIDVPRASQGSTTLSTWGMISTATLFLLFSEFVFWNYPGNATSFVMFDLSFLAMLLLVFPRPRSYGYIFFASMLFLGFWAKLMLHLASGANFIEPFGDFSGTAEEWERALQVASVAAIGVSLGRVIQIGLSSRFPKAMPSAQVPAWYENWRKAVWIGSVFAMLALHLLNLQLAFYQTGVNPRLILPYHLNVPLSWLVSTGFALWFAVLIFWEFQVSPRGLARTLLVVVIEGFVSSTSALSRSFYFLHTFPYIFAISAGWKKFREFLSYRTLAGLLAFWAIFFVISLTLVQFLRIQIYHLAYVPEFVSVPGEVRLFSEVTKTATLANQIKPMADQISKLFVDRWIGLEGVLAVTSFPQIGFPLLADALREDPKKGSAALYQTISKSKAEISQRFTFGTLPGIVGVLFYSGSLLVVFGGMLCITLIIIGTEWAALRFTANPFFVSVLALGLAHVVCQINFPYLAMIYVAQLWVAIAFVWLLQRGARAVAP